VHSLRETLTGCLTNIKSYPIITAIVTIFNVHKVTQKCESEAIWGQAIARWTVIFRYL